MAATITIQSDSIRLEPCENGYILSWTECCSKPGPGGGPYDTRNSYETEKLVFTAKEGPKALAKLNELYGRSGEEMAYESD